MSREVPVSGDAAVSATSGFTPLKAGQYIGKIIDVKPGTFKGANSKGQEKIEVQYKIIESGTGEGVNRKIKDFNVPLQGEWLNGSSAFIFYQFFGALGVEFPKKGESGTVTLPDDDELMGEEIGLNITIEDSNKKDDDDEWIKVNKVAGYFPASKGLKVVVTADENEFTL